MLMNGRFLNMGVLQSNTNGMLADALETFEAFLCFDTRSQLPMLWNINQYQSQSQGK
jgi:hypothetical protein